MGIQNFWERKKREFLIWLVEKLTEKRVKQIEKIFGRKVSFDEKLEIADNVIKDLKKRAVALGLSAVIGFGGGLLVSGNNRGNDTESKDEGSKTEWIDNAATPEPSFTERIYTGEPEKITIPVETKTPEEIKREEEMKKVNSTIKTQKQSVDNIRSKTDALNWIKRIYASEYNKKNEEKLYYGDLKFLSTHEQYMFKADEQYVTHGSHPYVTEDNIRADGKDVERQVVDVVYTIYNKDTSIDCMTYINGEAVSAIPGNNYNKYKDSNLTLASFGDIPRSIMELYDLYRQLENKPGNTYIGNKIDDVKKRIKEEVANYFLKEHNNMQTESDNERQ